MSVAHNWVSAYRQHNPELPPVERQHDDSKCGHGQDAEPDMCQPSGASRTVRVDVDVWQGRGLLVECACGWSEGRPASEWAQRKRTACSIVSELMKRAIRPERPEWVTKLASPRPPALVTVGGPPG
ncbi:hypothetical protein D9M72_562150 [compost metagenome]